jgi:hypothetical protein
MIGNLIWVIPRVDKCSFCEISPGVSEAEENYSVEILRNSFRLSPPSREA